MSYLEEKEFWDMTPHRIKVTSYKSRDNHGRKELDETTERVYRCLVSQTMTLARGLQGTTETVGLNAHTLATPVDGTETVDINTEDKVEFVIPAQEERPIQSVEKFYDETGSLHNMVVHFS